MLQFGGISSDGNHDLVPVWFKSIWFEHRCMGKSWITWNTIILDNISYKVMAKSWIIWNTIILDNISYKQSVSKFKIKIKNVTMSSGLVTSITKE